MSPTKSPEPAAISKKAQEPKRKCAKDAEAEPPAKKKKTLALKEADGAGSSKDQPPRIAELKAKQMPRHKIVITKAEQPPAETPPTPPQEAGAGNEVMVPSSGTGGSDSESTTSKADFDRDQTPESVKDTQDPEKEEAPATDDDWI